MQTPTMPYLQKAVNIILIIIGATVILYYGQSLLAPLTFALVLAMLLIPLSRRMEKIGVNRGVAAVLCIIILIAFFALVFSLIGWQLSSVISDMNQIGDKFTQLASQAQAEISSFTGIGPKQLQDMLKKAGTGNTVSMVTQTTGNILGVLVNVILVLVYIFLLMYFRQHLMKFLLKAVPDDQRDNVAGLVGQAGEVSQKYLSGLAFMIMTLWVMYGIGFSVIGVKHAVFFALLCGTLEIVPFIGNITGTTLTVMMGIVQGGDVTLVISILVTYGLVQFIQSYILQPLIVGKEVNLNPFFTIVSIIIGDAIWGVSGMILAVPVFGMVKIVCDHFDGLKPYGFLLGSEEKDDSSGGFTDRIKKLFKR